MTKLEDHLDGIINIFHQYSVRLGHSDTLSKGELMQLITKELANFLQHVIDQASVDKIFKDLDADQDTQVNFSEFANLMITLLLATHEEFHRG
ncbi:protein S100-A12 [Erinaceus europaeus]|uniref:Protein S100-A12 n=1 Tax=Erinaceus europaeus TaxID=9365 RepID=A0A1S3WEY8_ERIEU|nr:protein S100-A12 [Erinaceus europaeus]